MSEKKEIGQEINNSQRSAGKRTSGFLLVWLILLMFIWFVKSDNDMRAILRMVIQNYLYFSQNHSETSMQNERYTSNYKVPYNDTEYCRYFAENFAVEEYAEALAVKPLSVPDINPAVYDSIEAMPGFSTYLNGGSASYEYLSSHYYVIDSTTSVSREELNAENLLNMDLSIDTNSDEYKILIYHTHGTEAFVDSKDGKVEDSVIGVGDHLTELLEERYGVHVYHDRTAYDIVNGELDRSAAYDYAREGVEKILAEYPSIEVVIDLHRDGVAEDTYLVTEIEGKKMAQIMFLNGVSRLNKNGDIDYLKNPYKIENLAFSLQLFLTGKANYDTLMRKIYVKGYRYNLDFRGKSLLIEVGGQTNTVEEAKNAMEPFAAILYKVLSGG